MKQRLLFAAAAVLVAGLVVGGVSLAGAINNGGITNKRVVTFVDVTVDQDFLDVGPPGGTEGDFTSSAGDTFFFHDELWNRSETIKRGTVDGKCTSLIGTNVHCVATITLAAGTIELSQGLSFEDEDGPSSFRVAITGGTGRYKNVVGQATLSDIEGQENKSLLRLELIPSFRRA